MLYWTAVEDAQQPNLQAKVVCLRGIPFDINVMILEGGKVRRIT